jgi:small subunit ribosomal protein S21
MAKDGILKELKKRRAYEKPSVKRKRKRQEAKRRRDKVARRYSQRGSR